MDISNLVISDDLTEEQKQAIKKYFSADRHFFGFPPGTAISDFRRVNKLREEGKNEAADSFESGLLKIMTRSQ